MGMASGFDGSGTRVPRRIVDCGASGRSRRAKPRGCLAGGAGAPALSTRSHDPNASRMAASSAGASKTPATYSRARLGPKRDAVEGLHLLERVAAEHRLCRERPAVGVVAVDQRGKALARDRLRRALLDGEVAQQPGLHAGEGLLRKPRLARNLRDEACACRAPVGKNLGGDRGGVGADRDRQLTAHSGELARERVGRASLGPFLQHPAREIRQPDLVGGFVQVAGVQDEADGNLRHLAERHERDRETVGQREPRRFRQGEVPGCAGWRWRLARRLGRH